MPNLVRTGHHGVNKTRRAGMSDCYGPAMVLFTWCVSMICAEGEFVLMHVNVDIVKKKKTKNKVG